MKSTKLLASVLFLLLFPALGFGDLITGPFCAFGQGGIVNGQTLTFGTGGEVYEINSFITISGFDLNGGTLGTSGQLSVNPLPAGLAFSFTPTLSGDMTDLTLSYRFVNNTGGALNNVHFFPFVDAQIDAPTNTKAEDKPLAYAES